ncbi:MAG: ABC transporter ATP-binding protein [Brevinematia bacterium]
MNSVIYVKGVSHTFLVKDPTRFRGFIEVKALQNIDLEIEENKITSIVGESGSGKTTLANIILGFLKPTKGDIIWKGNSIFSNQTKREYIKHIYFIPQNPANSLNPRMNIKSIISEPLLFRTKLSKKEIDKEVRRVINEVNLSEEVLKKYPHELSGGEKQRVSIARSIIAKPSIIVLDEPVSSLDVSVRAQILNLLKELKESHNLTYIYISHDIATTRFISDNLIILLKGRIMEIAPSEEIFQNPKNPYTQFLIYSVPKQSIIKNFEIKNREEDSTGCPFYNKCPIASEICKEEFPKPKNISETHIVYCHNIC